jgi:hypothetical protein
MQAFYHGQQIHHGEHGAFEHYWLEADGSFVTVSKAEGRDARDETRNQILLPRPWGIPHPKSPYCPDPLASGLVAELTLYRIADAGLPIEPEEGRYYAHSSWPHPRPILLSLETLGPDHSGPADMRMIPRFGWGGSGNYAELQIRLKPGVMAQLSLRSLIDPPDRDGGRRGSAVLRLQTLVRETHAMHAGVPQLERHWLLAPARELLLVHAVDRPVKAPVIRTLQLTPDLSSTSVDFHVVLDIDAASTGRVELTASWTDPVDDPKSPEPTTRFVPQQVKNWDVALPIGSGPEVDQPTYLATHQVGDTKYHRATYVARGVSRFVPYFVGADKQADPEQFTVSSAPRTVHIRNRARPDLPDPLYAVPVFRDEQAREHRVVTSRRRAGALRIWMERKHRGWYSSGDGELLGVVLANGPVTGPRLPEPLASQVTLWGRDPLWKGPGVPALPTVRAFVDAADQCSEVFLPEVPEPVAVVGYKPEFSSARGLWYADIRMRVQGAYMPFVRLALARYHPISVRGAHLSKVVLMDFAQLVPDRWVTLRRHEADHRRFHLQVLGSTFTGSVSQTSLTSKGSVMRVRLFECEGEVDDLRTWRPVSRPDGHGDFVIDITPSPANLPDSSTGQVWATDFEVPRRSWFKRYGLLVEEIESYFTETAQARTQRPVKWPADPAAADSGLEPAPRVVYAEFLRF